MDEVDESTIPSAPVADDEEAFGGRIFERIRRPSIEGRQCAPFENTWLALDRIVIGGRIGLAFHPLQRIHINECLDADLVVRDLGAVGFRTLDRKRAAKGDEVVITEDCPGVRLRALIEAMKVRGATLPRGVVWYLVSRTAALREVWRRAGVEPYDTFIGFDGSVHLFPTMPKSYAWEMISFNGDIVFDPLIVDDSARALVQVLLARLPETEFPSPATRLALRNSPRTAEVPPEVRAFLDAPRTTDEGQSSVLASLLREHLPRTYARHRRVYAALGHDLDAHGLAREASILAGIEPPRSELPTQRGPWLRRFWPWGR